FGDEMFPGMSTLVASHDLDLIMLQLGVNDIWNGDAPIESILANYETMIQQGRAHNPNMVFVVAQIHRVITDNCAKTASTANAERLVMAISPWAVGVSTLDSPVFTTDLWTNSDHSEAVDCVYPNDSGAQRSVLDWFTAL